MYRGCSLLPVTYRKQFANSLILPHFDYLDTIYGQAPEIKLYELDILYKKIAKIALGVEKTEIMASSSLKTAGPLIFLQYVQNSKWSKSL